MMRRAFGMLTAALLAFAMLLPRGAAADDLDRVEAAGELRIAMSGQYPPFNFVDDRNEVVGFDVDIGKAIAERMGVAPAIVTTAWDGIIAGLLAGKYDAIVGSMTITDERRKAVDFVGPYYRAARAVFLPEGSPARSLADLEGKRIGATLGETHERWARDRGGWTVRTYKGLPELLLELRSGRLDAIVVDDIPVRIAMKETGDRFVELDDPAIGGAGDEIGIAIRKDNPGLKAAMQQALDEIMADGTYEAIAMRWIGSDIR